MHWFRVEGVDFGLVKIVMKYGNVWYDILSIDRFYSRFARRCFLSHPRKLLVLSYPNPILSIRAKREEFVYLILSYFDSILSIRAKRKNKFCLISEYCFEKVCVLKIAFPKF